MRFTKFGKALCIGALSACVVFGISSCVKSYTTGYLYVTGTVTAATGNNGIISGIRIDHNTGAMNQINGLPIASGGSNPVRAVLADGNTFLYVLNRGAATTAPPGGTVADCYGTGIYECQSAYITQFAVGGNGSLTYQNTFYSKGLNPFRMILDSSGNYLMVLDHDAPDNVSPSLSDNCSAALGSVVAHESVPYTCGDITIFKILPTTGYLSAVLNTVLSSNTSAIVNYFPVPANPVDFVLSGSYVLTLAGAPTAPAPTTYPYTGGAVVWPYSYAATSGQLTVSSNSVENLQTTAGQVAQANAIVLAGVVVYVLDNEMVTATFNGVSVTSNSQIIPYTAPSGVLQIESSGVVPDAPCLAAPISLLLESKGKFLYVANQEGNTASTTCPDSGIAGYFLTTSPSFQLSFIADEPFGSGTAPQCIVEDPSDQFIYEANGDSTVTGRLLDPNSGDLDDMRVTSTYKLQGPATWCIVDGRTN